jgi:hypothetical protein
MNKKPSPRPDTGNETFPAPQEILNSAGGRKEKVYILPILILRYEKVPETRIVRHGKIHGCRTDNGA